MKVSRDFKNAFDFVMDYFQVEGEELEYEKSRVRENYPEANQFYLAIYAELHV